MKKKSRQVSTVFELAQEQETTDGEEEATDTERLANRRKSVKLKGPVKDRWNKLKAISKLVNWFCMEVFRMRFYNNLINCSCWRP